MIKHEQQTNRLEKTKWRRKRCLLSVLLAGTVIAGYGADYEPEFKIRGVRDGNWWILGDSVGFKALSGSDAGSLTACREKMASGKAIERVVMPETWSHVIGTVFDSSGIKLAECTVDAKTFARDGWTWKPSEPGFYSVAFSVRNKTGDTVSLCESINSPKGWTVSVPAVTMKRRIHNFAVSPGPPKSSEARSCFGVNIRPGQSADSMALLPLVRFGFVRLHYIPWFQIEPDKGVFHWDKLDTTMTQLRNMGMKHYVGNIFGTPVWASSRPDAPGKSIWQDYPAAYAPAKISDLTDFLNVLVRRYPEIKIWEPWNEPNLPGQSIFWRGSPEEYAALLKASYETIKKLQPDGVVWLGGIGMRYLPFYRKIIELGGGTYFDVLPLHGRNVSAAPFDAINRHHGVSPKPWVQGEWHAILFKTAEKTPPSEQQLSQTMLLDLMGILQSNAEKVAIWGWGQGTEREFHRHFHDHGEKRVSIGGFYRASPYVEPRFPLLVLRSFMDCFSGKISFLGSYVFDRGNQQAALLDSADGNVLFFWQNGKQPIAPAQELASAVNAESKLLSWEGRTLKFDSAFRMQPETVYFLKSPAPGISEKWEHKQGNLLKDEAIVINTGIYGNYHAGELFDSEMDIVDENALAWHAIPRYVSMEKNGNAEPGIAGRFAVAFSPEGLDLLVDVKDRVHAQHYPAKPLWEGDSVQFAIDATGKGHPSDRIEFSAALTRDGPLLWKQFSPMLQGDLPAHYTDPPAKVEYGKILVRRQPDGTLYKIRVNRGDLFPFAYDPNQPVRFSLLVNDSPGDIRAGYLEWSGGIGNGKHPAEYGTLTIRANAKVIFSQKDLSGAHGKEASGADKSVIRANAATSDGAETIRTGMAGIVPNVAYNLSFRARGNVDLRSFLTLFKHGQGKGERMDVVAKTPLKPEEWTDFSEVFIIPQEVDKAGVVLFSWKQSGWYEIKDFKLEVRRQ